MAKKKNKKQSVQAEVTNEVEMTASSSVELSADSSSVPQAVETLVTSSETTMGVSGEPSNDSSGDASVESSDEVSVESSDESSVESLEASEASSDNLSAASTNADEASSNEKIAMNAEAGATDKAPVNNSLLVTDRTQIKQVLEATIFAAPKAMSTIRLRNLLNHFNYDSSQMVAILAEMIDETTSRGFQLIKVAGGYQFRTHPEHSEVLQKLLEDKPARLSASALEVLAIVAYKQPVSRADIDSVRGVDSGHLMKGLLEKNLVRTLGHAETPGRPLLYGTTPYFLEVFSLGSLDDLPQMDEISRELSATAEGEGADGSGELDLGLEGGLNIDSSGLAANPNRGAFDQPFEEETHAADFGLTDRAREEVESTVDSEVQ